MDRTNHSAETAVIQLGKKIVHKNRVEQGGQNCTLADSLLNSEDPRVFTLQEETGGGTGVPIDQKVPNSRVV